MGIRYGSHWGTNRDRRKKPLDTASLGFDAERRLMRICRRNRYRFPRDVLSIEKTSRQIDEFGADFIVRMRSGNSIYFDLKSTVHAMEDKSSFSIVPRFLILKCEREETVFRNLVEFLLALDRKANESRLALSPLYCKLVSLSMQEEAAVAR